MREQAAPLKTPPGNHWHAQLPPVSSALIDLLTDIRCEIAQFSLGNGDPQVVIGGVSVTYSSTVIESIGEVKRGLNWSDSIWFAREEWRDSPLEVDSIGVFRRGSTNEEQFTRYILSLNRVCYSRPMTFDQLIGKDVAKSKDAGPKLFLDGLTEIAADLRKLNFNTLFPEVRVSEILCKLERLVTSSGQTELLILGSLSP